MLLDCLLQRHILLRKEGDEQSHSRGEVIHVVPNSHFSGAVVAVDEEFL